MRKNGAGSRPLYDRDENRARHRRSCNGLADRSLRLARHVHHSGIGSLLWLIPWMTLVRDSDAEMQKQAAKAADESVSFGRLMASPVIWGTIIGTFCYMYFVYFCLTWMPAYFIERRNLSLTSMGTYTFFSFGGMATMAALAGWAADRPDRLRARSDQRPKGIHHRGLRSGFYRSVRCVFRFRSRGTFLCRLLANGPRSRHGELLGSNANPHPRREYRQDCRHSKLRGESARNRGSDSYRMAEANNR